MHEVKVGDMVRVILEDHEHPFLLGEKVKVTELIEEGCIWAKNSDGVLGCLIPMEFKPIPKKK